MFSRKATRGGHQCARARSMPLYLAGCMLRDMMFWVPQTGSIGLGIVDPQLRGQVHFGLITDAKPDARIRIR